MWTVAASGPLVSSNMRLVGQEKFNAVSGVAVSDAQWSDDTFVLYEMALSKVLSGVEGQVRDDGLAAVRSEVDRGRT